MKNRKAKKGFTIIELVIVIAVIGILAAVLIPTFSNVIADANAVAAKEEANNVYTSYIAEKAATEDISQYNFCIKVTKGGTDYFFHVVNGQLYDAADGAFTTGTRVTPCTIENGELTLGTAETADHVAHN